MNEIIAEHDEYFRKFEILNMRKGQLISISGEMCLYRKRNDDTYSFKNFIYSNELCLLLNVFKKNENTLLHGYTIPHAGKAFSLDNAYAIQVLAESKILNLRCYYDCISFID